MANLTTLSNLKVFLNIPSVVTNQDPLLTLLISQCSDLIQADINRVFGQDNYLEYYEGQNTPAFVTNQRPIYVLSTTGTLTEGSPIISDIPSTTGLIVGMPVSGTALPQGTDIPASSVIDTINSSTEVTLNQNAGLSGNQQIVFGIQVWLDYQGYWGMSPTGQYGTGSFPPQSVLAAGQDFTVELDGSDPTSKIPWSRSGAVYNTNGYWPEFFSYNTGMITPYQGPISGNIKCAYTAGYATIPANIELACLLLAARVRNTSSYGAAVKSEKDQNFSYELMAESKRGIFSKEVSSILAKFRNIAVG